MPWQLNAHHLFLQHFKAWHCAPKRAPTMRSIIYSIAAPNGTGE